MEPRSHGVTERRRSLRLRVSVPLWFILAFVMALLGCATDRAAISQERFAAARELFDRTTKLHHLPSAQAEGGGREKLLRQAAAGYEQLLRRYPDQPFWCAQALRSLGNIRAEQGRIEEAIRIYNRVAERYSQEEWEVLQAWKSSADLLWDAGSRPEAKVFYQKVVDRFDTASASAVVKAVVRGSKARLASDAHE